MHGLAGEILREKRLNFLCKTFGSFGKTSYLCTRKPKGATNNGAVVQLVRILACHARGRGFEPRPHRKRGESEMVLLFRLKTIYLIIYINDSHYGKQEEILSGSPSEGAHLRHRLHGHSKQHRLPSGPLPQPSPVWEGVITTDSWPHRQYIILHALGRGRSRNRDSGGRTHLLHRSPGGLLLQHGQEQARTLPQGIS